MSDFLKDLLNTDDLPNVPDGKVSTNLFDKVSDIKKEITKLKSLANDSMKDKYAELKDNFKPDGLLLQKSEKLILDINTLQSHIDDQVLTKLISSSKELQNLSSELKEYNYSLHLSEQLLKIHKAFCQVESFKSDEQENTEQYTTIAKTLVELHKVIIEKNSDILQLNLYVSLKEEYLRLHDGFVDKLVSAWRENVYWNDAKNSDDENSSSLSVQCNHEKLSDIVQALFSINKLQKHMESLSSKLLQNLINPIINFECLVENTENLFTVKILNKKKMPKYKFVLEHLKHFFRFLQKHFEIPVSSEKTFFKQISDFVFEEFSNLFKDNCISKILPDSTAEMETFKRVVSEIVAFQTFLIDIKFMNDEQKFLTNYTDDIDELYLEKKVDKILDTARNILKKDLHDSICYKPESMEDLACGGKEELPEEFSDYEILLDNNLLEFPPCQISKSALEIIALVEETLKEASPNPEKFLPRFFYTTRNIFKMYTNLVPMIHKSYLETIPQQVALFHNNCLYLSHQLITLPCKFCQLEELVTQKFSFTYMDLHVELRDVGVKYFLDHMKYQKNTIFEILRESGLSTIGHMPELPATTERAVRQCIRQLELLKTVWIDILPILMFYRVMSCLINNMIDEIIAKVVNVEDIPANVASELVTLFNILVKRLPQIYLEPHLIEKYVKKWRALKEVIIILGASLREIEDRWADGKGPLAQEFTPQQVKQLIRALFQNTERRSCLLSRIKEKS